MLEKPAIADEDIITCLAEHYGLYGTQVVFLPDVAHEYVD
jgi:hypothetical protein